jgi:non-ribosomal peptide synthetase component F
MVKAFDSFGQLRRLWNAAYEALTGAESVMVIGFSFPRSDAVIGQMLRSTLARCGKLKRVAVVDVNPDAPINRLAEILRGCGTNVLVTPFQVPEDGSAPAWFN